MEFGALKLKRCRYGWMLFAGPYIGTCFDLYGQYSESEVAVMRSFLREGSTVIDVGANIGDLTLPLSLAVGESGSVIAIESHSENFNVLCANIALNQIRNTLPINALVTSHPGEDAGTAAPGKYAFVSERWKPGIMPIDSLELDACDLIKIDVDGKELDVLESGVAHIERFRPILYFENDVEEASAPLLEYAMRTLGYDLYAHTAPIYEEKNFFGNPVNHWAPRNVVSLMVLGIPSEKGMNISGLRKISDPGEWWPELRNI